MTQLASAVDAVDKLWTLDTLPDSPYLRVDDELVEISARFPAHVNQATQELRPPKIRVKRGVAGTSAASHAEAAELAQIYEVGESGGAPAVVHYSETDPGAVGAGHLWIQEHPGGLMLWVRNDSDTQWEQPRLARIVDTGGSGTLIAKIETINSGDTSGQIEILARTLDATLRTEMQLYPGYVATSLYDETLTLLASLILSETGLNLTGLPTVNPNVAGDVWNDAGTLKISAG